MKSGKRILIFYLSIGSGHQSASAALKLGLLQINESHQVFCEDLFTPAIRNSIIPEFLSLNSTIFLSKIYNDAWQTGSMKQGYELLVSASILKNRVLELVEQHKPDLIVCTHSLPCSILSNLKAEGTLLPKIFAVSTDFMVHPYWPIDGVEGFVVASEKAARKLTERGLDNSKVWLYGIPVDPKAEILAGQAKRLIKSTETFTRQRPFCILVLAGGKRLAPYVSIWSKTISMMRESINIPLGKIHWNIVCGKPSVFRQILTESTIGRDDVTIHDYVHDFLSLLNEQDLVITKPGGLILAECSALGIPAILVSRGSGQEAANCEVFTSSGAGFSTDSEVDVIHKIQTFIDKPLIYQSAMKAACDLGKPDAARLTSKWLLEACE
jgi:processive 1,2-diacylglycerol beta-glucosyltransferase